MTNINTIVVYFSQNIIDQENMFVNSCTCIVLMLNNNTIENYLMHNILIILYAIANRIQMFPC